VAYIRVLFIRNYTVYTFRCYCTCRNFYFSPSPQEYMCRNESLIIYNQARYSDIYLRKYIATHYPFGTHPHIHQTCIRGCTYYPQLSTFIYTCVKYVNIPVTKANTPVDRRLDGHALTAHTYHNVEAYRSIHCHSSKWHPYNFTPYGQRKKKKTLLTMA